MVAIDIHKIIGRRIRTRGIENNNKISELKMIREDKILPKNQHRKECLYYIYVWLLVTMQKRSFHIEKSGQLQKKSLYSYNNCNETDIVNLNLLPIRKIDKTEVHTNMICHPKQSFFIFVAIWNQYVNEV